MRLVTLDARARGMTASDALRRVADEARPLLPRRQRRSTAPASTPTPENPKGFAEARDQARSDLLVYQRRMRDARARSSTPSRPRLDAHGVARTSRRAMRYVLVSDIHYDGVHGSDRRGAAGLLPEGEGQSLARPGELAFTAASVPYAGATESTAGRARARCRGARRGRAGCGVRFPAARLAAWSRLRACGARGQRGTCSPRTRARAGGARARARLDRARPRRSPTGRRDPARDRILAGQRAAALPGGRRPQGTLASEKIEAEERGRARAVLRRASRFVLAEAWSVRWASVDSSQLGAPDPKDNELSAWYESHEAEFARLDPGGGGIQTRTFEEVRPRSEARWRDRARRLRRAPPGRRPGDGVGAQGQGRTRTRARSRGAGPPGSCGAACCRRASSARSPIRRMSWSAAPPCVVTDPAGFGVVGLVRYEPRYQGAVRGRRAARARCRLNQRVAADRAAARDWYEAHRERFTTGNGYAIA